jgi:hypothetical protein
LVVLEKRGFFLSSQKVVTMQEMMRQLGDIHIRLGALCCQDVRTLRPCGL